MSHGWAKHTALSEYISLPDSWKQPLPIFPTKFHRELQTAKLKAYVWRKCAGRRAQGTKSCCNYCMSLGVRGERTTTGRVQNLKFHHPFCWVCAYPRTGKGGVLTKRFGFSTTICRICRDRSLSRALMHKNKNGVESCWVANIYPEAHVERPKKLEIDVTLKPLKKKKGNRQKYVRVIVCFRM